MTPLESARAVADAVLYEGYLLYPYRASAPKNQVRWQWGVLMPADVVARDDSERRSNRTDLVIDGRPKGLRATVRFLQVQQRYVEDAAGARVERLEAGDTTYVPWDEAREIELLVDVPLKGVSDSSFEVPGGSETEELEGGRLVRVWEPVTVGVRTAVRPVESAFPVSVVTIEVENRTALADDEPSRRAWLRRALVACHLLVEVEGASFVSQLDGPQWAAGLVTGCENDGLFPVLAGPSGQDGVVLSSPIILYDHPELAPQSESTFFDSLEIDELLSLRTMTLSEAEKREMRGTDPRAAALLDEVEHMPDELWDRLHGTVRYLDTMAPLAPPPSTAPALDVPWWDPGADGAYEPESDAIRVGGVEVSRGTRVLLRPGARRADAHDLFLAGRHATVAAVLHDVDGNQHLAVTLDDDPGADLKLAHGRYLYFAPDEVEVLAGVKP